MIIIHIGGNEKKEIINTNIIIRTKILEITFHKKIKIAANSFKINNITENIIFKSSIDI
ncbi:MAG: hypothetical protein L3J74_04475 [Bacteroidales bacterium]|nr:hypothetical protein [Bacteroidales bacterium]